MRYKSPKIFGWMSEEELEYLYNTVCQFPNGIIVELGSWEGRSAHAMATSIVENQLNSKLCCIDTWEGGDKKQYNMIKGGRDPLAKFLYNTEDFSPDVLEYMVSDSVEASEDFGDNTVAMVFIDANHLKRRVQLELQAWVPKIKPGGLICGHDWTSSGVRDAVLEFRKYKNVDVHPNTAIWYFNK